MNRITAAIVTFFAVLTVASVAFAQAEGGAAGTGAIAIASALAIGLGAIGATLAQGRAAAAALEGIARNPSAQPAVFTPMLLGLALMESIALFAFLIAFFLQGKI